MGYSQKARNTSLTNNSVLMNSSMTNASCKLPQLIKEHKAIQIRNEAKSSVIIPLKGSVVKHKRNSDCPFTRRKRTLPPVQTTFVIPQIIETEKTPEVGIVINMTGKNSPRNSAATVTVDERWVSEPSMPGAGGYTHSHMNI